MRDFVTWQDVDRRIGRAIRVILEDALQAGYLQAARDLADQLDPPPPAPGGSAIARGRSLGSLTPPADIPHTPKSGEGVVRYGDAVDRYVQLGRWPERRPFAVNFHLDFQTRTVFVTDPVGLKLLAVPFDRWFEVAEEVRP